MGGKRLAAVWFSVVVLSLMTLVSGQSVQPPPISDQPPLNNLGLSISQLKRPEQLLQNKDELVNLKDDKIKREESLRAIIRKKLSNYKAEVVEALDLGLEDDLEVEEVTGNSQNFEDSKSLSRSKRATITADNPQLLGRQRRKIPINVNDEGSYVIRSVFRVSPQFFDHVKTLDINAVVIRNQTYMFTLEVTPEEKTQICVYIVGTSLKPKEISRTEVPGAISLEVVQIDKYYYILPLVYNWTANNSVDTMDVGSNLYRVDLLKKSLVKVQTIRTAYAHSSVFWKGSGEEANAMYLAVAPEYTEVGKQQRYAVKIPCYRWQGGYFDYVSSVPANNPQAIRHFNLFSHDYLVISNYQDDSGSTNIHSEVFKYYHKESRFVSFQRIRTYGAKDIQHFSFRGGQREEHFLAVANHCQRDENGRPNYRVKSFIMKFAHQRFIPFKSFYTNGALQFLPVTQDDKFYLVLAEITGIRIFQYNGWTFVQTFKFDLPDLGSPFYSLKLRSFRYENQPYFAVASVAEKYQGGIYSVQFDQRNDYSKLTSALEKWCLAAKAQMDKVNITQLQVEVDRAPKINDDEILLSQPLTFSGLLKASNLHTKTMHYRGIRFDSDLAAWLTDKWAKMGHLHGLVDELVERMSRVVFRNQDHYISNGIVFQELKYRGENLITNNASVDYLNGFDIPNILRNLIFRNKDLQFSSLEIDSVEVLENLKIKLLNGRSLSDYAVKNPSSDLIFTKKNTFLKEVTTPDGLKVRGYLDGVDFNKPNFLLAQGNQTFEGLVYLKNCTLTQLFTKYLNGYDVAYYFKEAVPLIGDAVITGSKQFKNITIENFELDALVNGFNLDYLLKNAIRTSGREYQSLIGRVHFQHLITTEVSLKNKLVNGRYDLEKDFVNIRDGRYSLGDVILLENTFIENFTVLKKLNRLGVTNGQLEIVLKDSLTPQRIKNKRLESLHFESDVTAEKLVDGVNLKDWTPERRILLKNSQIYRNYTILGNLSVPKGIRIKSRFRQGTFYSDILPILKNIALLNSTKLPGSCNLIFESLEVKGNTEVRRDINGIKPSSWLVKNHIGTYDISGAKYFFGDLTLEEDCVAKALYGSEEVGAEDILKAIPNLLLDGVDQTIYGDTAFTELLQVENLDCPNVVLDKVPFENLLFKRGDQVIDVETYFEGAVNVKGTASVRNRLDVGSVNDVELSNSIMDTLRTGNASETQHVQGEYTFNGGLYVQHMETDGLVGDYDLGKLFASIVRKDRKEPFAIIDGSLVFENGIRLSSLEYTGEMNGIKDTDWGNLWLLNSGNQTVYTPVEFLFDLIVDEGLYVNNGGVGDLNVIKLSKEILRKDEGGWLGNVRFYGDVKVSESIQMDPGAKVNGVDLRNDVLVRNSSKYEQVVSGEKTFENGWIVKGKLNAHDIDGLNLIDFLKFLFEEEKYGFKNDTLVVEGNLKLVYEPEVTGTVNGLYWDDVLKDVWFTDRDAVIKDQVTFKQLNLNAGGYFSNDQSKLSTLNLNDLKNNYISKKKNQSWRGNVKFNNGVYFHHLKVQDLNLNYGLFKGVNLTEFIKSILTNGTNQILYGKFSPSQLTVNHIDLDPRVLVNDLDILKDLMTINGSNIVFGKKYIENLKVEELLLGPDTTLGGVNLTDWVLNSVKTVGDNYIQEALVFENFEDVKDMIVTGLVDGVKYDMDHILLKNGSQTIRGQARILSTDPETAALTAPHGIVVDGLFNNYDLNKTFSNLILKSEYENDTTPLVIEGRKVIMAPIQVTHFRAEKYYQGEDLSQLLEDFYTGLIIPSNLTFKAKEQYEALSEYTQQVSTMSNRQAVFLEYFVFTQEILQESLYSRILYGMRSITLLIGYQKSTNIVSENWWSYSLTTDYYQRQLGDRINIQGKVVAYKEIESKYGHFVIISVSSVNKRAAQLTLEMQKTAIHSEIDKAPGTLSKTFILKSVDPKAGAGSATSVITQVIYGKEFGPLETFEIYNGNKIIKCVLVTSITPENSRGGILCIGSNGVFTPFQDIPLQNPGFTTSMQAMNTTFLMIATGNEEEYSTEGTIEIWSHSGGSNLFKKENCIPIFNFISMDAVYGSNINPFLVVASGALPSSRYLGSVFIYRYSIAKREFEKTQTLEIDFPLQVRLLVLEPSAEVLLFVLTNNVMDNVLVFKYQGLSGWTLQHKWTSIGGTSLDLADFVLYGVYKAQVLVTSPNATRIYTAEFKGLSSVPEEHNNVITFDKLWLSP